MHMKFQDSRLPLRSRSCDAASGIHETMDVKIIRDTLENGFVLYPISGSSSKAQASSLLSYFDVACSNHGFFNVWDPSVARQLGGAPIRAPAWTRRKTRHLLS
jgi:hypothetical protein